jgi:signal transduction histidine kinase
MHKPDFFNNHDQMYLSLRHGLGAHTFMIMIVEELAFIIIALTSRYLLPFHRYPFFGKWMGSVVLIAVLLGFVNGVLLRLAYRMFVPLADGLKMIAEGNFSVRMPQRKRNFLEPMYIDFNKMADELEHMQILRSDFINNYSHEFKTPIASINGFANLMLRQDVSESEKRQYLEIIASESKRLADLAEETLLLTRLDVQQIVTDRKPYLLDEQLRTCVIMLSNGWNKKNINFSGDFAEVLYTGNEELMQHLWINLLSNAIKFTPDGGDIAVSLVQEGSDAIVTVADNGVGMDSDTLAHIYEKFYQGETGKKLHGLGLGLSIVKRIIELCNGSISVVSRVNEGSTFTVRLPLS